MITHIYPTGLSIFKLCMRFIGLESPLKRNMQADISHLGSFLKSIGITIQQNLTPPLMAKEKYERVNLVIIFATVIPSSAELAKTDRFTVRVLDRIVLLFRGLSYVFIQNIADRFLPKM